MSTMPILPMLYKPIILAMEIHELLWSNLDAVVHSYGTNTLPLINPEQ